MWKIYDSKTGEIYQICESVIGAYKRADKLNNESEGYKIIMANGLPYTKEKYVVDMYYDEKEKQALKDLIESL